MNASRRVRLSERQREVLVLLRGGYSISDTAAILEVADGTVRSTKASAYRRLRIRSRVELRALPFELLEAPGTAALLDAAKRGVL